VILKIAKDPFTKCNCFRYVFHTPLTIDLHQIHLKQTKRRERGKRERAEEKSKHSFLPLDFPPQTCAFMYINALWPKARDNFNNFQASNGYVEFILCV
jgi:hypothetical protein